MQVKDVAASVVLGLLFLSLLAIYLVTDQNPLVTGLCIIIIAICLIIVRVGDWREIGIIGGVAAVVSVVAAYLVGENRFGSFGSVVVPTVWALLLVSIFGWISANVQRVPNNRAILSRRTYTGEVVNLPAPLATPLIPFLEATLAEIPLYPLSTDEPVSDINTQTKNVTEVRVHVEYQVKDRASAPRAMDGIPNRGLMQTRIAKELNKTVAQARTDVLFWERLLDEQMRAEVDDVTRDVMRAYIAHEVPKQLGSIVPAIQERLNERVNRWGVVASHVAIDKVTLPPDPKPKNPEEEEKRRRENDYARITNLQKAQSDAEAERVRKLIETVRAAGIETISTPLLEDIIVSATSDSSDRVLDSEMNRWFNDNYNKPTDKK